MYKSTFMGLNTALRGVLAHQNAIDVTSHNISNLSTEGYSRQRAEMVTAPAWSNPSAMSQVAPGQMGTGVEVQRIERLRDQFIDANVRQQLGRQGASQAMVEQMTQVEAAFQEPGDSGLKQLMANFWAAMDTVAGNANSPEARQQFAQAADALAAGFNQVATDLQAVAAQSDARLNQTVTEINGISTRIAALNTQVRDALVHNQQPNDLLDERDRLMDQLATLVNYTSTTAATGEVTITFGTAAPINLVDPLAPGGTNAISRLILDTAYGNGDLTSGRAFTDEQLFTTTIPGYITQLDGLVANFVAGINAQHMAGTTPAGLAGGNVFDPAMLTAATMRLDGANNILANPALIAASNSGVGTPEPGNGRNLQVMLDTLRGSLTMAGATQSWETYYSSVITSMGTQAQAAQRDLDNADMLVDLATSRRDQVSGVSLDEEMSNMLRFQHAYNASARVMTAVDEMLDQLINRMGRVGL